MNWIEKFAKAISVASEHWEQDSMGSIHGKDVPTIEIDEAKELILSHAPVRDAEALAEKLVAQWDELMYKAVGQHHIIPKTVYKKVSPKEQIQKITQLITSGIDLNITWVDGKAEWGQFELFIHYQEHHMSGKPYEWEIYLGERYTDGRTDTQALAIKACEQALRSIVCGVKGN